MSRYQERRRHHDRASGRTISWSGLTVMIGLLGLLWSPILETRCVGIGGALVVCVSVLAALTLLPAALVLLGDTSIAGQSSRVACFAWMRMRSGIGSARASCAIRWRYCWSRRRGDCARLARAARAQRFHQRAWFLARGMEARIGVDMLTGLRGGNAPQPIYAIVRATDGAEILDSQHLPLLIDYAKRLAADARIVEGRIALTLQQGMGLTEYMMLYLNPAQACVRTRNRESFISRDRRSALV